MCSAEGVIHRGPPATMINIRIVCTHDAVGFAETLARLLSAEDHLVRLHYGRHSLHELESARAGTDAVVLIWSKDAPSQHYMLEWLRGMDPTRMIEVARAPSAPVRADRRAPVIDFSNWRGDRGSRPWGALNERLKAVARALEPAKPPPKRAALALGLASVAAVTSAVFVRADQQLSQTASVQAESEVADLSTASSEAVGGPLLATEPASAIDPIEIRPVGARLPRMEITEAPDLPPLATLAEVELREPTLLERIGDISLLRDRD